MAQRRAFDYPTDEVDQHDVGGAKADAYADGIGPVRVQLHRDRRWPHPAALRFATVSVRTSARSIAYGQMPAPDDPDDLIMFRPLLEAMLTGAYWD